jgi:hypothetical protein
MKSKVLLIILNIIISLNTVKGQECDSVYQFSNLSDYKWERKLNKSIFSDEQTDSTKLSYYNFYDFDNDYYYNFITTNDSIVAGTFSMLIWEMKYDSANIHLARNRHEKYGAFSDNPEIYRVKFTKNDIKKLNQQIDLTSIVDVHNYMSFLDSNKTTEYYIDGLKINVKLKCDYVIEYSSKCKQVIIGLSNVLEEESSHYRNFVEEIDTCISFKKKENKIIKNLPFKYYAIHGDGCIGYTWKKLF